MRSRIRWVSPIDTKPPASESLGRRGWPFAVGALLLAAAVAKIPLSGLDIWWHLRTGEALLSQPGWLPTDPFSWTAAGQPWAYKDIGADILLAVGHRALGDASLSLWPALAVLGLAGALWRLRAQVRGAATRWWWPLLLLSAVVAASQHRLHARPMLFSHVAFAWLLVGLPLLGRPPRRARVRAAVALVALLWAWAWLHRGALVGVATVWAWALATAALALVGHSRDRRSTPGKSGQKRTYPQPGRAAALAAAAVALLGSAVVFATPNGTALLTTVIAALGRSDYVEAVAEWAPIPAWTLLREHGSWWALLALAVVGVGRRVRRGGALEDGGAALTFTALALGLSAVALGASRWIPYAALASAFAAAHAWLAGKGSPARLGGGRAARLALLLSAACLAWVAARGGWAAPGTLATGRFPTAAMAFARSHSLPARLTNAYDFGGAVLWWGSRGSGGSAAPALQTEIDGRADMVYGPAQFRAILASHRDPRAFAARRAAGAVPTWVLAKNRPEDQAFHFLQRDRSWCLAFWSSAARIWLQRAAHPQLCARYGYRVFTGPALDATAFQVGRSRQPARLLRARAELARMTARAPDDVRPAIAAVVLEHGIGDRTKRDHLLAKVVARFGDDPAVLLLLRRLTP